MNTIEYPNGSGQEEVVVNGISSSAESVRQSSSEAQVPMEEEVHQRQDGLCQEGQECNSQDRGD